MIKTAFLVSTITLFIYCAILAAIGAPQYIGQCLFGGVFMTANFVVIYWSFRSILNKKSIALATTVIVSKYAVLIGILTALYLIGWRVNMGFALGLSVMFPLVGWTAFKFIKQRESDGSL